MLLRTLSNRNKITIIFLKLLINNRVNFERTCFASCWYCKLFKRFRVVEYFIAEPFAWPNICLLVHDSIYDFKFKRFLNSHVRIFPYVFILYCTNSAKYYIIKALKMETIDKLEQANQLASILLLIRVAKKVVHVEVAVWLLCKSCRLPTLCHCRVCLMRDCLSCFYFTDYCMQITSWATVLLFSNALATLTKWSQSSWSRYLVDIGLHPATDFSPCLFNVVFI